MLGNVLRRGGIIPMFTLKGVVMNREEVYLHWLVGGWGDRHFLKLDYRGLRICRKWLI